MKFKEVTVSIRFKDPGEIRNNEFLTKLYDGISGATLDAAKQYGVSVFKVERERSRVVQ